MKRCVKNIEQKKNAQAKPQALKLQSYRLYFWYIWHINHTDKVESEIYLYLCVSLCEIGRSFIFLPAWNNYTNIHIILVCLGWFLT